MTDTPASSTDTQKQASTAASSSASTSAGATETQQELATTPQTEPVAPPQQSTTSPYSTQAPTPAELEAAKKKAEALIEDKEPEKAVSSAEAKTTLMASGADPEDVQDKEKEPPEVEAPSEPQEHAKNGSKTLKVVGLVALVLVVGGGIGVGVTRLSSPTQTIETRAPALESAIPPGPIVAEVSDNTTPDGISFDVYSKLYGESVDNQWVMTDEASGATGIIYFVFDQIKGESLLFSRWENLAPPDDTVARLWLVKDGEYTWAGEVDFEYGREPVVGYGIYGDTEDFRAYDSLVLSYDPYDNLASPPTQIVMSVDIQTE